MILVLRVVDRVRVAIKRNQTWLEKASSMRNLASIFQVKKRSLHMKLPRKFRTYWNPIATNSKHHHQTYPRVDLYLKLKSIVVTKQNRTLSWWLFNLRNRINRPNRSVTSRRDFVSSKISLNPTLLKRPIKPRSRPNSSHKIFLTEQARLGSEQWNDQGVSKVLKWDQF